VRLHLRAAEFPFACRRAEAAERFGDVLGRLREHRLHGAMKLNRETRKTRCAFGQCGARDGRQIAREHRRAPHRGDRYLRSGSNRLDHHALERALAQFAHQQADEEVLLGKRSAREQRAKLRGTLGR